MAFKNVSRLLLKFFGYESTGFVFLLIDPSFEVLQPLREAFRPLLPLRSLYQDAL